MAELWIILRIFGKARKIQIRVYHSCLVELQLNHPLSNITIWLGQAIKSDMNMNI